MQLLARIRMSLSRLNEHKFKRNFRDFLNPLCSCNLQTETIGYAVTYSKYNGGLPLVIKEIDKHVVTDHKNDLDQIL